MARRQGLREARPRRRPVRESDHLEDLFRGMATEALEALVAVYDKYDVVELVESGEVSRVPDSARTRLLPSVPRLA